MRASLPASMLLHGGLLTWALIGFQEVKPFKPTDPEPVEVAIITEDGLTRLMQGDRNAKLLQAAPAKPAPPSQAVKETPKAKPPDPTPPPPAPESVKPEPAPPEPAKPEPVKVEPPPKPAEPKRDEIAELALKAEQEAAVAAAAKAEAERKAAEARKRQEAEKKRAEDQKRKLEEQRKRLAEKKRQEQLKKQKEESFDDMMMKALKDNDPRKRAPQPSGSQQVVQANLPKGRQAGAPEGTDTKLTASEQGVIIGLMRDQLRRCWNLPAGADGVDAIVTEVEFRLSPAGQLIGAPKVVSRIATPLHAAMADNAVRALVQCQPYTRFPAHLYKGGWDYFIWEFKPADMFR